MEALTALSVATSVIQFVDFGSKLLSETKKLYKSADGALVSTMDMNILTNDLATITRGLERKLPQNRPLSSSSQCRSDDQEALDKLCTRCVKIAEQLMKRLKRLQMPRNDGDKQSSTTETAVHQPQSSPDYGGFKANKDSEGRRSTTQHKPQHKAKDLLGSHESKGIKFSKWESFRKALEGVWNRKEIDELAATLREFRSEIEFRGALNNIAIQQSETSQQLAQSTRLILDTFLNTRRDLANELRNQSEKLIQDAQPNKYLPGGLRRQDDYLLGSLIAGTLESPKHEAKSSNEASENNPREAQVEQEMRLLMAENGVLGSLAFATMTDRRQSLDEPYDHTFQWIFEEPGLSNRPWSNFVHWLREEEGIYWVNGKVGSGKSTLMKFVYQNVQTREELEEWAGAIPIEVSGFFFWNSGDEDQKSQCGLLRSLLFDMLQRHRDMIPEVMPEAWGRWFTRATAVVSKQLPPDSPFLPPTTNTWAMVHLKRAFLKLLHTLQDKAKICLFIDGLDEYSGDYLDIIDLFQECIKLPNVKLCLSSRPLPVFGQAFGHLSGLRLQDLTRGDIRHYVTSRLSGHRYMMQLSERHGEDISILLEDIVTKSRGVFLWVKLVVRSLLSGLSDYNRISDLKKRVKHLPEDLEALYAHILKRIDPFYYTQTSQLFQIVRLAQKCSADRVTLLNLSWADDEDESMAENALIRPLTEDEVSSRCQEMDARLKSVCAGLLESNDVRFSSIQPDTRVMFLHRTVADWLDKPGVWDEIVSRTHGTGFSPNLSMLRSCILTLKSLEVGSRSPLDMKVVLNALEYAKGAEEDLSEGFPKLLDQLDIVTSHHWLTEKISSQEAATQHWSFGVEVPGIKPVGQASTFYNLAKDIGLNRYISIKYDAGDIFDQDVNQHLLMQSIPSISGIGNASTKTPDPGLVDKVLENGISPNVARVGMTPWEGVLLDAVSHFTSSDTDSSLPGSPVTSDWGRTAEIWARVIRIFMQHGADPDLMTRKHPNLPGHPRLTPAIVFKTYFPGFLADEADELISMLRRAQEKENANNRYRYASAAVTKRGKASGNDDCGTDKEYISTWVGGWILSWFRFR